MENKPCVVSFGINCDDIDNHVYASDRYRKSDSNSHNNEIFLLFFDKPTPNDQATIPHGVIKHKDSINKTHLVGEVKSTGSTGIKFAQIIATISDANNQTVGTGTTVTSPTDIPAGQSAPFDLITIK